MSDHQENVDLKVLMEGLLLDARLYFKRAGDLVDRTTIWEHSVSSRHLSDSARRSHRDLYWSTLPEESQADAKRLYDRLISLMGQAARTIRTAALTSDADQRDVLTATKAMRAALHLRRFRYWDAEVLNDEDIILGVSPAGQSDDEPLKPKEASQVFAGGAEKVNDILDLLAASASAASNMSNISSETVRYLPGTAFIMMWMDKSQPDLIDVCDAVKTVFKKFNIHALRADDIEHDGLITPRILNEIKTAEFCFADLSGARPNVYYEVGFAHAMSRRVILYRKAGTGLHFDLAGYNCPEYENLRDLKDKLTQRLRVVTSKEPSP